MGEFDVPSSHEELEVTHFTLILFSVNLRQFNLSGSWQVKISFGMLESRKTSQI